MKWQHRDKASFGRLFGSMTATVLIWKNGKYMGSFQDFHSLT